jgi:hypothetical protein
MISRRRDAFAKGVLLFAVIESAAWFVTAQEARYAINMYAISAIFGVLGWQYIARSGSRNARALSVVVVAISILYGAFILLPARRDEVHATLSRPFEAKWRMARTACAAGFDYINGESSVRSVLLLDEGTAPFFIDKPYVKPFGVWGEQTVPGATDVPEVMSQLASLRVTHVFDYRPEDGSFHLPDHPFGLTLVFEREDQRIYRVN